MDKIIVLDNGTEAAKVLIKELQEDYHVVVKKVSKGVDKVEDWFKDVEDDIKIYLPLMYHEVVGNKEADRTRQKLDKLNSTSHRNKIVLPYEGLDKPGLEQKKRVLGITSDIALQDKDGEVPKVYELDKETREVVDKIIEEDEDRSDFSNRTRSRKMSNL